MVFTLARFVVLDRLFILDINEPVMQTLAEDLRAGTSVAVETAYLDKESVAKTVPEADIIINCTPIGMHPKEDATLVPAELFRKEQVVFDVVYTPLATRLLQDAASKGCRVISGVEMFINQAALQFERFTGESAPVDVMRQVVMERLKG